MLFFMRGSFLFLEDAVYQNLEWFRKAICLQHSFGLASLSEETKKCEMPFGAPQF